MRLSDIKGGWHIERDGEFNSIAVIPRWANGALIPVTDPMQVKRLAKGGFGGCLITTKELLPEIPAGLGVIISEHPKDDICAIHNDLVKESSFSRPVKENEIDRSAVIHPTAFIAERGVKIGKDCIISPKASIQENSSLGANVVIGPGAVIGGEDTLLFKRGDAVERVKCSGGVMIGDEVEIHSNCCVSRAIFSGDTVIGAGTKFDNLIHIGQNTVLGKRCFLAACASIGANVVMGDDVWIGPNSTVSEGVTLGDRAYVTIGAVVVEDVRSDQKVTGNYAIDHTKFIEFLKKIR